MREVMDELEEFARSSIAAESYPDDDHIFTAFTCPECGVVPFKLTLEHHTGSEPGDFKGLVVGYCTRCLRIKVLFGYTNEARQVERREQPACDCGGKQFYAAMCERYEGENGLTGFFDEGVIVGSCAACCRKRTFVYTD